MVKLYSTGCPKCSVLKKKLEQKGVQFDICTNIDEMQSLGINQLPVLSIDDKLLNFAEAIKWVGENT